MRPALLRAAVVVLVAALGIVVGAGPLQRSSSERDQELEARKADVARAQARVDALESASTFAESYAAATAPTMLRGALAGRSVTVVTLPGADPKVVESLRADVQAAQGQLTGQVDLDARTARSSSRQLVEALTSQMVTQAKLAVPADAGGYERLGTLLGRALGTAPSGQPPRAPYDATAVAVMSGLETAGLLTVPQQVAARAGLVLVVTGPEVAADADAAENAVPVTILQALGRQVPTVVVGPTGAARERGVIGAVRANSEASAAVSTVDSAETAMGQVAGVLALAARARGTVGQFGGVEAADGVLPGSKG